MTGPRVALRETIRVTDGRLPLLPRHLARLAAGGCDTGTLARAAAEALRAAGRWEEPYGRMSLTVATDGAVRVEVSSAPSTIDIPGGPRIALVPSAEPELPPGAAKPADRSFWDRALDAAHAHRADVAVLVGPDGALIDTSQATLWLVFGTRLLTPPSPPALAGVSRGVVFDTAATLGLCAEEAHLVERELLDADEVVLTTAVAGARAVRGRGGPVAETLAAAFETIFAAGG